MVIRNLRRFTESQHAHEYPLCSRLIGDFERKEVLYLAGLFHDIAKGRGGDHSALGGADARRFCRAHGLPAEDVDLVGVAGRAAPDDVGDGAEAGPLRSRTSSRRSPRASAPSGGWSALYLLTVADIRGTSPKVWNAWKAQLLEDLFPPRARGSPGRPAASRSPTACSPASARRSGCCASTRCRATPSARCGRELDNVYFQRHTADEIAWHARHLHWRVGGRRAGRAGAAVARRGRPAGRGVPARPEGPVRPDQRLLRAAAGCRSSRPRSTRRTTAARWTRSRCTIRRIRTRLIAMRSRSWNSSWRRC